MLKSWRRSARYWGLLVTVAATGACGGDNSGPTDAPLVIAMATKSGDQQVGIVGEPLPIDLRVVVTRNGSPVEGVPVAWTTEDGTLSTAQSTSGSDGVAAVTWTLGTTLGDQVAAASVTGATGSPIAFTATGNDANTPVVISVLGPAGGNRFSPADVTVVVGSTVTWDWGEGALQHNVVPDVEGGSPPPSGPVTDAPNTYQATFDTPGTYRYHCASHGGVGGIGMSGTITVVAP